MMPMVFWASLVPWPRLKAAEEASWPTRKNLSTRWGRTRRKTQDTPTIRIAPTTIPISGDRTMKMPTFTRPLVMRAPGPALASPAPASPPMSECETLIGRP